MQHSTEVSFGIDSSRSCVSNRAKLHRCFRCLALPGLQDHSKGSFSFFCVRLYVRLHTPGCNVREPASAKICYREKRYNERTQRLRKKAKMAINQMNEIDGYCENMIKDE
jgi:hypothetical protein